MTQENDGRTGEDESGVELKRRSQGGLSSRGGILIVLGVAGVVVFGFLLLLVALLLPAVQRFFFAARMSHSASNLSVISVAIHNFHDVNQHFPPMGPKELQPGDVSQSWMAELLPYVSQAPVYNLINRQAPWDDASNRRAMSVVIPVFFDPNLADKPIDPSTGYALAHYAGNEHVFGRKIPLNRREFADGLSNTMLAGSVTTGLRPWGDPTNTRDPAAGFGSAPTQWDSVVSGQIFILLADGSVRTLSSNTSPQVMTGLAKPNDGVIPPYDLNLIR